MRMQKRGLIRPWMPVAAGLLGLVLIVLALWQPGELSPARSTDTPEPRATSDAEATSNVPQTVTSAGPTSTVSLAPTTRAPTDTPVPSATPTKTATPEPTPTPTPTPISLSPPVVNSRGAVAYVEGGRLTIVRPEEPDVQVVDENVAYSANTLRWSPDSRRLAYTSEVTETKPGSVADATSIQVWDGSTGEVTQLRSLPGYPSDDWSVASAVWSPAGTRLLLSATGGAPGTWIYDLADSLIREIPGVVSNGAAWIDDDRLLVRRTDEAALGVAFAPDPRVPVTGTLEVEGTHALSPGRDLVAFLAEGPDEAESLRVASVPGFAPRRLPGQPAVDPASRPLLWSPDGRWIAYGAHSLSPDRMEGAYTLITDAAGEAETRIVPGLLPEAWSSDGRLLAAFGCTDGSCRLSLVEVSSGEIRDLASSDELELHDLAWSPGGVYLAYSLTGPGLDEAGLVLWNRAAGEGHRLLEGTEAAPLSDLQWSSDGCRIYAARGKAEAVMAEQVSEIWMIGPAWEERWQIAPAPFGGAMSLTERLNERRGDLEDGLCPGSLLEYRRVVAYYGTPLGPGLGILGRHGLSETLSLLENQIQEYRAIDSGLGPEGDVTPGFHMVTTIADDYPGPDGDYNHRVPHTVIRPWIEAVRARGGMSILDVQPGLADLAHELDLIEPLLREPSVHLAVDPEFIVAPGEVPGRNLGRITGPQVNYVQSRMDQIARETGEQKMVVIHQFDDRMIAQKERILDYPLVDLVWDADGFGGPGSKIGDYNQYRRETGFEYGGFKIFYRYDEPVITPAQILGLEPVPRLVIYQ